MSERGFVTEIWAEKWFRNLSYEQRYLYIYLSNNDHCNPAGVYSISLETIANESKLPLDKLSELLQSVSPYIEWYSETEYVWVKDFIKRQLKSPKFLVAVAKALKNLNQNGLADAVVNFNLDEYTISIPYIPYQYDIYSTDTHARAQRTDNLICSRAASSSDSSSKAKADNNAFSASLFNQIVAEFKEIFPQSDQTFIERLRHLSDDYSIEWVGLALKEAVESEARIPLAYMAKVLKSWKATGKPNNQATPVIQIVKEIFRVVDGKITNTKNGEVLVELTESVSEPARATWAKVLSNLSKEVSPSNYRTWLGETTGLAALDGKFFIGCRTNFVVDYLEKNLCSLIEKCLIAQEQKQCEVVFVERGANQ